MPSKNSISYMTRNNKLNIDKSKTTMSSLLAHEANVNYADQNNNLILTNKLKND